MKIIRRKLRRISEQMTQLQKDAGISAPNTQRGEKAPAVESLFHLAGGGADAYLTIDSEQATPALTSTADEDALPRGKSSTTIPCWTS